MTSTSAQKAAVEPVRAALMSAASAHAAMAVAQARAAAEASLHDARRAAEEAVARAAAEGAASARPAANAELARSRQIARALILEAEQATYQDLTRRIRAAVLALRDQPGYPRLRQQLADRAARAAGPGSVISAHDDGGVIATAPGIVVDCSLGRLTEYAIALPEDDIVALCGQPLPPWRPGLGDGPADG